MPILGRAPSPVPCVIILWVTAPLPLLFHRNELSDTPQRPQTPEPTPQTSRAGTSERGFSRRTPAPCRVSVPTSFKLLSPWVLCSWLQCVPSPLSLSSQLHYFYLIEVWLICNVVVVSAGQHSDSVIHTRVPSLPLWFLTGCWIQSPGLHSRILLFIHSLYNSFHLLTPSPQSSPNPHPLGNHKSSLWLFLGFIGKFISSVFYISHISDTIWYLSFSNFT